MDARTPRFRRRKDERPQEIIDAALDVFVERGFAAARLDEIARRAGVTKGTLYLYFDGKERLLRAAIETLLVPQVARIAAAARADGTARETLTTLVQGWVALLRAGRITALPKLIIGESGNFPDLARFYLDRVIARGMGAVEAVLRRGMRRGELRKADARETARLFIAPLLHAALWRHTFEPLAAPKLDVERFFASHLDLFLRGLAPGEA